MPAAPAHTTPWPAALENTPTISVIEQAIMRGRLSHSLLLTGDDIEMLANVANAIADRMLNTPDSTAHFPPEQHPDCFALRPTGKMRQIGAEPTRQLIGKVQVSPSVSMHKVGLVFECDRMNTTAANVFLKTLEEPPANTTLIMLTTRPYALLTTIRSRCLNFRFPAAPAAYSPAGWAAWLTDYQAWLERLASGAISDKRSAADSLFNAYGLIARFGTILDFATKEVWEKQKKTIPAELTDDEKTAIETGITNGLRLRLFVEIEYATRAFALPRLNADDAVASRALSDSIAKLEHVVGLLRLNLNESAVLENFLLSSLRLWTRR